MAVPVNIGERRDGSARIVSKWEPDPVLSEYVKIAWQLRAAGKSYKEITEATKEKLYKSAPSWHSFFRNKAYLGIGKSGELEVADHHEPLITFELWEAVQRQSEAHPLYGKKGMMNHPRRVGYPTLLSGFTYCLECGAMTTHSPGHKKAPWRHYICGQKNRRGYSSCNSRRVGADKAVSMDESSTLANCLTASTMTNRIALLCDLCNRVASSAIARRSVELHRKVNLSYRAI